METKDIIDYIRKNGIDYDTEYANVDNEGCIDEYSSLAKRVKEDIESNVLSGVNNGFTADIKSNIEKLTKIAVKISKEKNAKKSSKFLKEIEKTERVFEKKGKAENTEENIRDKVLAYIDTYYQATKTLKSLDVAENRKYILDDCLAKLDTLKETVNNVCDISTTSALDYAKSVIAMLKEWGKKVSILMHSESSVKELNEIIVTAEEWKNSRGVVIGKTLFHKGNKVENLDEIDFIKDDMYMIGKSTEVYNNVKYFEDNLKEYQYSVSTGRFGTESLEAELKQKSEEISSHLKEKNQLVQQFKNKEITEHELYTSCKSIDEDVQDIEKETEEIRKEINKNKNALRAYNRVFRKLEKINKVVLSYKNEPVMLSYIGGMIDFERISRVMHGTGSEEDINHVVDINTTNIDINNHTKECYNKLVDAINNIEETEEEMEKADRKLTEKDEKTKQKAKEEEDAYIANLLKNAVPDEKEDNVSAILSEFDK